LIKGESGNPSKPGKSPALTEIPYQKPDEFEHFSISSRKIMPLSAIFGQSCFSKKKEAP